MEHMERDRLPTPPAGRRQSTIRTFVCYLSDEFGVKGRGLQTKAGNRKEEMKITRLGWAGIEVEHEGESAVIDYVTDLSAMEALVGPARRPLPATRNPGSIRLALATHLHGDHADPAALGEALSEDGMLLRPRRAEGEFLEIAAVAGAEEGLSDRSVPNTEVEPWESVRSGPFRATAVPAVDAFGDPQVSWVLEAGGRRILHGGDTMFHGSWWLIRMRLGPIDAAFLPVNGPVVNLPHRQPPSAIEAALTPEQAVLAARILQTGHLVPIHYDTIDGPPAYEQTGSAIERVRQTAAEAEGLEATILDEGGVLDLDQTGNKVVRPL